MERRRIPVILFALGLLGIMTATTQTWMREENQSAAPSPTSKEKATSGVRDALPDGVTARLGTIWQRMPIALLSFPGGGLHQAEPCLLRVLETDSGNGLIGKRRVLARHHLACIYRDMGRLREAAHWRAMLAEDPSCAEARHGLDECAAARLAESQGLR